MSNHRMILETGNGTEFLFVCPVEGCGRRLILNRCGALTVLDHGDFFALHSGGTSGLEVSTEIGSS